MKFRLLILVSACLTSLLSAQGESAKANESLRASIQKWVAIMKETQEKRAEWRERKQILKQSKEALLADNIQMESEILAAFKRIANTDEASQEKLADKREYDEARESLRDGLNDLDAKISALIPLLPKELAERPKLEKEIVNHRNFVIRQDKEKLGLNARLTAMLTILTESEKFNQVVTPFTGRSAGEEGNRVLLDGIYFGLAMGFAANEAGTIAFQLRPGPDGWEEVPVTDPDLIEKVRALIDVGNAAGEVQLVDLPLEFTE